MPPEDTALSPVLGDVLYSLVLQAQSCHEARWHFVTASPEEFGIKVEQMEENPPCKQDINF